MILHDVSIFGEEGCRDIRIRHGIIESVTEKKISSSGEELTLDLAGAIALPGFINSHDHLEFNCYPALGDKVYKNYTEWGPGIQKMYANTIREVSQIPETLRVAWGLFKNLFNGFTTVVNHGKKLTVADELISVFQDGTSLHSPAFEKNWKWKLRNPLTKSPIAIHVGEGTDEMAHQEINDLVRSNWFRKKLIGIHGVSMDPEQAKAFAGLVWCPASNYFFLGTTAAAKRLAKNTRLVFGTDSTLTTPWNIQQHFRLVSKEGIAEKELAGMLTSQPAELWNMNDRGSIAIGKKADLTIIKKGTSLFDLQPADILLILHQGNIRLADDRLNWASVKEDIPFTRVQCGDTVKIVQGRPLEIAAEIKNYFPSFNIPFTAP